MQSGLFRSHIPAAHLAILAVAPLCLFPFCSAALVAQVIFWLAGTAFVWSILFAAVRPGEIPPMARLRFLRDLVRDPAALALFGLLVLAALRLTGEGVVFDYDAELGEWCVRGLCDFMPSAAAGIGILPLAASVGALVLAGTLSHSCDEAGRTHFLNTACILAGIAGVGLLIVFFCGNGALAKSVSRGYAAGSFEGVAFGLWMLVAVWRTLVTPLWKIRTVVAVSVAVLGTSCGLFLLAPAVHYGIFAAAGFVLAIVALVRTHAPRALAAAALPLVPSVMSLLLPDFKAMALPGADFLPAHAAVGSAAVSAWLAHPWFGTGLGTLDIDLRLFGDETSWKAAAAFGGVVTDAFRRGLAERGAVGMALSVFALSLIFARVWRKTGNRAAACDGRRTVATAFAAIVLLVSLLDASILWIGAVFSVLAVLSATTESNHG